MPSSFGLWFSSYAESLIDDMLYLKTAYKINDQNPLGSAAGYGSSFNLDRDFTTSELGFSELKYNVISSQMNRGKVEKSVAIAISAITITLSKFHLTYACIWVKNLTLFHFQMKLLLAQHNASQKNLMFLSWLEENVIHFTLL